MTEPRASVIVLANQKGGCGKSTTAVNLAGGFAREGLSTCLVDLDSQCNATGTFSVDPDELRDQGKFTVADAFLANKPGTQIELAFGDRFEGKLTLLPGHRALDQVQAQLDADLKRRVIADGISPMEEDDLRSENRLRLKKSLAPLVAARDFIVIDTPPRLGFELTAALLAADWYIIPVFPSKYDVDGLSRLTATVQKVRQRGNAKLRLLAVILGNYKANTVLHQDVRAKLKGTFPDAMCETVINDSVRHGEATFRRQTIYEAAPGQQAANQFAQLTREILDRLQVEKGGVKPLAIEKPESAEPVAVTEAANG
ncbi:MAG: Chromosome-partitioning ATPase Soj [Phycisphaerae bacterium]|nr:Chromosome-partitioning ATPase Soj [Phycisphaerae bacterium]